MTATLDTSRGLDAAYVAADGSDIYYSTVHNSWVRRWEEGGEPYSENVTGEQALAMTYPSQADQAAALAQRITHGEES